MKPYDKFFKVLLEHSVSKTIPEAIEEWIVIEIYEDESLDECICDHVIKEVCVILNLNNQNQLHVGNCCVKKFMNDDKTKEFVSIKRVKKDQSKSFHPAIIQEAHESGVINNIEEEFYTKNIRKRVLSRAQMDWKAGINRRVLMQYIKKKKEPNFSYYEPSDHIFDSFLLDKQRFNTNP